MTLKLAGWPAVTVALLGEAATVKSVTGTVLVELSPQLVPPFTDKQPTFTSVLATVGVRTTVTVAEEVELGSRVPMVQVTSPFTGVVTHEPGLAVMELKVAPVIGS